jgi:hypothetical protein
MMGLYAIVRGGVVDAISVADSPVETDGTWVCIDGMEPKPMRGWLYQDGELIENFIKIYVPKSKIHMVLSDVWSAIESASASDSEVRILVEKINSSDEHEFNEQYDKDLEALLSRGLITQMHVDRLRPVSIMY